MKRRWYALLFLAALVGLSGQRADASRTPLADVRASITQPHQLTAETASTDLPADVPNQVRDASTWIVESIIPLGTTADGQPLALISLLVPLSSLDELPPASTRAGPYAAPETHTRVFCIVQPPLGLEIKQSMDPQFLLVAGGYGYGELPTGYSPYFHGDNLLENTIAGFGNIGAFVNNAFYGTLEFAFNELPLDPNDPMAPLIAATAPVSVPLSTLYAAEMGTSMTISRAWIGFRATSVGMKFEGWAANTSTAVSRALSRIRFWRPQDSGDDLIRTRGGVSQYKTSPMRRQYRGEELGHVFGTPVEYLDDVTREAYRLRAMDGRLVSSTGRLFDTTKSAVQGSTGRGIFVMDSQGNIYARLLNQADVGLFHHSSFLSGSPVAASGEFIVENGVVRMGSIAANSGHYRQGPKFLTQFIEQLKRLGVDISGL